MQNEHNIGLRYVASGNLFIIKEVCKTVPFELGGRRGNIKRFSEQSAVRMRRYLRTCLADYTHMVTLTYPCGYPTNGAIVKNHLKRFIQELKRELAGRGAMSAKAISEWSVFWFFEFQKRGAPHFHLFCTHVPDNKWISKTWYRIVDSEDERHLRAGTNCERFKAGRAGTISYAAKYAAKATQKDVPEEFKSVGRFWGVSGRRAVLAADTFVSLTEMEQPKIKCVIRDIKGTVSTAIMQGKAEVIVRKEGVYVAVIHEHSVQKKLRSEVSRLTAITMNWSAMFEDAELNIEGYGYA